MFLLYIMLCYVTPRKVLLSVLCTVNDTVYYIIAGGFHEYIVTCHLKLAPRVGDVRVPGGLWIGVVLPRYTRDLKRYRDRVTPTQLKE